MSELPGGTVTFLFTDIEGSTKLLRERGAERYAQALADHRRVLRDAFTEHGGVEVDTQGDAFFVAFATAQGAVDAARAAQAALEIPVRMGVHTGTPLLTSEGYVGHDVHKAARVAAAGHGRQVLLSESTVGLIDRNATPLRDLGEHRLKDLTAPHRIFQLGDGEFPPLKTLYRTNLPVAANPLIGRAQELAELQSLLCDGVRVVTLTGPGGTGKTRLALQAAAELSETFADGVFWVPLQAIADADLVLASIAQAVDSRDELVSFVRERSLLLLLDNFEHVLAAAPAIAALVSACPRLRLLVTSRAPLRIEGEYDLPLDPLPDGDASVLFAERARAAGRRLEPDETVVALCQRLDNLPLALELAAARAKLLEPAALLNRLDRALPVLTGGRRDAPQRQRTLRATIEWSNNLLDDESKLLFARLSVFRGTFALESAEHVCAANLDVLASLVDASLVKTAGDRFLMLETIREYAGERLAESEAEYDIHARHAAHFLDIVESAPGASESAALSANVADTSAWRARVDDDLDNVRAALEWFRTTGDASRELRGSLVVAWLYLWMRGGVVEAARWFESILERADLLDAAGRVDALQSLAHFGTHLEWEKRRALAEESLALARSIDDKGRIEWSLRRLGNVYVERDAEKARELLLECEPLARELPEKGRLAWIHQNLGLLALREGDYAEARQRLSESVTLFEQLGGHWQAVNALEALGMVAVKEGRFDEAREVLGRCLPRALELDAQPNVADCLVWAAGIALDDSKPEVATRMLGAAAAAAEREGWNELEIESAGLGEWQQLARERLGERFETTWSEGRDLTLAQAATLALEEIAAPPGYTDALLAR